MLTGWIATVLLTVCAIPQLVKILKTRQSRDISSWTWWLYLIGQFFAIVYSFQIHELPLQIKYAFNILLAGAILVAHFKYK